MATCLIGLGSNLGDRRATLDQAVTRLRQHDAIQIAAVSSWHTYAAVGGPSGQGGFLNGVARLRTELSPLELRRVLHQIELDAGRERTVRWAARTLDVDLLLYDQQIVDSPELQVPHPRMVTRRFVLEPAAEVAAEMVHPPTRWTIARLLDHLRHAPPYFAITGLVRSAVQRVAAEAARESGAMLIDVPGEDRLMSWAGPFQQRELEFARRRFRALELCQSCTKPQPTSVSNFWIMQSAAWARELLSDECLDAFVRQLEEWNQFQPKLVVLLDAPTSWIAERLGSDFTDRDIEPVVERLKGHLDRQLGTDVQCPTLALDAQDLKQTMHELVAAMTAMQ